MNLVKIFISIPLVFPFICGIGHHKRINKSAALNDTLSFSMHLLSSGTLNKLDSASAIRPVLAYDFEYQYPYYKVLSHQIRAGDRVKFRYRTLPIKGNLYLFSVDCENTVKIIREIPLSDSLKRSLLYLIVPDSIIFGAPGKQRICLWYSTDRLVNADKLIDGIELTMGSFVYRNNGQLGKNVLPPGFGWHLTDDEFGFVLTPQLLRLPEKYVLPIIIEFEVKD